MIFEKIHRINIKLTLEAHYGYAESKVVDSLIEYINSGFTEKEG